MTLAHLRASHCFVRSPSPSRTQRWVRHMQICAHCAALFSFAPSPSPSREDARHHSCTRAHHCRRPPSQRVIAPLAPRALLQAWRQRQRQRRDNHDSVVVMPPSSLIVWTCTYVRSLAHPRPHHPCSQRAYPRVKPAMGTDPSRARVLVSTGTPAGLPAQFPRWAREGEVPSPSRRVAKWARGGVGEGEGREREKAGVGTSAAMGKAGSPRGSGVGWWRVSSDEKSAASRWCSGGGGGGGGGV